MRKPDDYEVWALQRAEQIVLNEGMELMQAAQWLDKKRTLRNSQRLRNEICRSLLEAFALRDQDIEESLPLRQRKA